MFQNKDVICFLGDSITANGRWMAEVYQVLRKKYGVKCYNCGVSGGRAAYALGYLHSECLIHNPDYVTVMFGINDIDRWLYNENNTHIENKEQKKKEAIELCLSSYTKIVEAVINFGATPIVCIPSPYDEVSDVSEMNLRCQSALDELERGYLEIAEKHNCPVVNFKNIFMPMLGTEGIICPDRIHPTEKGQHIIAQKFLFELGEIEEMDFDTPFVFEDWNKKRFETEGRLTMTNFVEFAILFERGWAVGKTSEEKKQMAQKLYDDEKGDKTDFSARSFLYYIETIDVRPKILGDIVRLTI